MGRLSHLPLWLKVAYSLFLAVLVPFYWINYGPQNFLWFCDVALLMTLPALWREDRLLASMPAVGILLPQLLWIIDFFAQLFTGSSLLFIANYMFDPQIPLFVRGLSSFHGWLPFLLFWMVWKLGYDRRALAAQTALCWLLLVLCFTLTERQRPRLSSLAAGAVGLLVSDSGTWLTGVAVLEDSWRFFERPNWAVNVNSVFGRGDKPQTAVSPLVYLAAQMLAYPLCIYVPTHFLLRRMCRGSRNAAPPADNIDETTDGNRLHRAGQQPGRSA